MHITLLRHGKPSFQLSGLVRAEALPHIANAYRLSGIIDTPPPSKTMVFARQHDLFISSDLPRSVESAQALGLPDIHLREPLFHETPIPHFSSGKMALPIGVWITVLRLLWLFGFSRNGESYSDARRRGRDAAERLANLANEHGNVILIGHGFMNHFIAKELNAIGWSGPVSPGKRFWEYASYRYSHT
ncbi:MAG: histidine phosphatase family protein [Candidatus Thiodiazotropha sp. (ex Monitilora ramsayi)]|nr:histidine phosphatase family protein [Candidatus Thiodiazotropha sp. (ex Monitilora ramsayi)]